MTQALTFNDVTFSPVTHQNTLWIRAAELARALGYAREELVSRLYQRNSDEFTPDMTQVIEIVAEHQNGVPGNLGAGRCRIFSLRGCHLLAMFARTPVAKAFRVWVLDVLDKLNAERSASTSEPSPISRRTDPERKALTSIINTWVGMAPIHYAAARAQVNAHFGVTSVDALTVAQVKEAIQYVQGKIDALPAAPAALPPASGTAEVEAQLATIRAHAREIMDCERRMYFTLRDTLPPLRGVTRPLALCLYESMDAGSVLLDAALKQVENTARLVIEYGRG
jgi:prophage antirepressor-like protein